MIEISASVIVEQLSAMELSVVLLNFLALAAGLTMHYIKKAKVENVGWIDYWTTNKESSLLSVGGVLLSFICVLIADPTASLYMYFSLGYIGDSVLNRTAAGQLKNLTLTSKQVDG